MAHFHADRQTDARHTRRAFRATLTRLRAQAELHELRAMLAHSHMQAEIDRLRVLLEEVRVSNVAMRTAATGPAQEASQ